MIIGGRKQESQGDIQMGIADNKLLNSSRS